MKLHLPLNLYRSLLLALFAAPALLHADNAENATTIENTGNSPSVGYTNINGDIQYTDSFIRENSGKYDYLDIDTLIFEGVTDILFYNNNGWFDGGAFGCDKGNASFINNGDITFKENVAEWNGGAIENSRDSTITFCDNGNINFEKNSVSNNDARNGGAITNEYNSSISLSGNGNITFDENSVTGNNGSNGGAIYNGNNSTITLSDNGGITFESNNVTGDEGSNGGAIFNDGNSTITLSDNGEITFEGNSVKSAEGADGGAIYNYYWSTIAFSDSGNINFNGNNVIGDWSSNGGAIYNYFDSTIAFRNNGNITFERNSVKTTGVEISCSHGGAIYNYSNSTITFDNNDNISFEGNSVEEGSLADYDFDENTIYGRSSGAEGGAISNTFTSSVTFSCNKNISFEGNKTTGFYANGGAIYNDRSSIITFDNNGDISFVKNSATDFGTTYPLSETASTKGGAIYNAIESTITFDNNANISFVGNSTTSIGKEGAHAKGAAIYNYSNSTITFDNNANISFVGNSTTSIGKGADGDGGAINNYSYCTITFDNNGDISFEKNSVTNQGEGGDYSDAYGGAIYNNRYSIITFNNNANISFEKNSVTNQGEGGDYSNAYGGAICNDYYCTSSFNNNANISFTGNTVTHIGGEYSDAYGGAIYNDSSSIITFSNNGNIFFEDNSATSNCEVSGGAIYNWGDLSLIGNKDITFHGNSVTGTGEDSAQGGAIYNWGDLSLIGNKDITFHGNSVTGTGEDSAQGGAIYNWGDLSLIGNKDITFQGNCVTGTGEDSAQGGAIYHRTGNFILSNNGNVLFEKNIEKTGNAHRLRSIYSTGNLILGAADNKKIEFRDSIYSSATISFNADYVDESGNAIKQTGDIIFTGAYTEAHLKEAKGGIAGTADEILASRTSEITGTTTLYGGRLRIEDGAIFKGRTLNVADNANATVLLRQGTLDLGKSYDLTISANSTLSAIGENTINASNLNIKEGGALQLALDFAQLDSSAVLTTTGNLNMGNIAFDLTGTEYLVAGDYKLLTRTEGFNYDISGWTLNGVTADKLRWENGTLYYTGGHDWNHGVTDDDDISDLEEILGNLIINGGDVTLEVVVQAIQDAVDAGFGHGKGHIVINRGGIHISGAGDLDGHIIFNGDLKYIRKLFIEKDITNIKIELGGSSAAQNIVDVGGEYTVEIDALSGDGSMSKTGEGEMVIHGKGHKVGGTLDVQEGSLTFSVGNGATDNETETEINELVVGNKEDKNAKVKVDKDTKVKGNKLHLDGKNAVVTNEGTMEFSGEVKVEAGHLDNQGHISKVTLEGGTVSGSGTFDGLEMNSGELIVGNSPGLQLYTDAVELKEGMVIFSLSDACIAATEETHGWDSAAYSTIDMGGNALTLSENVNFVLEIGGRALENLVAEDGSTLTFSLNLIQNIDPESLTLDEEALAALLDNTKIIITEDADGLSDSLLQLAGIDITAMLSEAQYIYEGNTLVFKGTVTNDGSLTIPEPSTATLSLLALAAMAARRRRK